MGDLIEIKTSNDEQSFYMISSGALKFHVKGKGKAAIGLASCPYDRNEIKIIIGNEHSWTDDKNKVKTINIISEHTYNSFWISWYGKEIRIGKGNNPLPFLVKEKLIDVNCISFSSFKHNIMNWKFRLPPKIKEPVYKKINNGQLKWVKMDGNSLPEDALIGGYENEVLYIMRAMHKEALTPGKYVPSKKAGYVAWGYDAHKKTDMEVLCGYDGIWVKSQNDEIPQGALEGGYSEVNCETLYVGRATYDGYLIPGKVQPSHKILCGYDGIWVPTEGDRIPPGALVGGYTEYHETMFVGRAIHNNIVIPGKIAPSHKILCGYDCIWVPTEGHRIPPGALVGGYTEYHETMFVGRAIHNNIVIPGKIAPSHKILCGYDCIWVPTEGHRIPPGALVGGYTEYHETMFVGRAIHNNIVIPGKIAPSHKVCYIPYKGNEISKSKYEILISPNS